MDVHSFSEIEARRERLGISQVDLCRRADVNEGTYTRHRLAGTEPMLRIRRKLWATLVEVATERGLVFVEEVVRDAAE